MGSNVMTTALTLTRTRCTVTSHAFGASLAAQHAAAATAIAVAPQAVVAMGGYVDAERVSGVVVGLGSKPWAKDAARLDGDPRTWSPPV